MEIKRKRIRLLGPIEDFSKEIPTDILKKFDTRHLDIEKYGYTIPPYVGDGEKIHEMDIDGNKITFKKLLYKIPGRVYPIWINYAMDEKENQLGYLLFYEHGRANSKRGKKLEIYETPFFDCRLIPFLHVNDGYRNKGIGGKFIDLAIDHAIKNNCKSVKVSPNNIKFFESKGFEKGTSFWDKICNAYYYHVKKD